MNTTFQHNGTEVFVREFNKFKGAGNGTLTSMRKDAINRLSELGFPTTKHEEWKYTNISPILKGDFTLITDDQFFLTQEDIKPFLFAGKNSILLVFENGRFNEALSSIPENSEGIVLGNLSDHFTHPAVKSHLGKYAGYKDESFIALNTAFVNDGAFLYIPANGSCEQVVHILYLNDTRKHATVMYPRNLIVAEKNSSLKVLESYHTLGHINQSFSNSVTEILVEENAAVEMCKLQAENAIANHISHTEVNQTANSRFNISTITFGGNVVRNNLHIVLDGVQAEARLYGLYLIDGKELVDNHTLVDHASPNCYSNELYKGILDEHAQGVFNGKVLVRQDAQKTNAYQSNKNILMSDDAVMNTKPQLEIFADDVKCSHGATTGQLDEEALFYLRSRGIGEKDAKAFLNIAFAAEIIRNISSQYLQDRLMQLVEARLKKINSYE
ncbi:MAG: Fe-S cluster assembly protein SufD [Bacteroidetes bacterium]|nr:MAG: Fe-S cluster assembly protein SufD [Bacteroidota bacterium]REK04660.1 MAG: Fe-S cluster assembly protein SufD [Bacteroidota bacterium]REK36135.1 MAG: Fe-S cluster assembly protein SufD [Bacteroidota bacterium]REK51494.1 MAG: Fe-S cluster assembly protein SufD [Bacteroidota bacterium]